MSKDRNLNQIIRKDARGCFVESLNDVFSIGKAHLAFVAYDLHSPAGQRQTDNIHIYLDIAELLELCRKAESGELRQALQALTDLTQGSRLVGIISHVAELKEKIDRQIVVTKDRTGGSRVEIIT